MNRDWGDVLVAALLLLVGGVVLVVWAYMPVAMGLSVVDCWDDLVCTMPFTQGETHYSGFWAFFMGAGTLLSGLGGAAAPAYVVHYNLKEKPRWAPWARPLAVLTLVATLGASVGLHALGFP